MKFFCEMDWICRRAGGLFLGLRVRFPSTILYEEGDFAVARTTTVIQLGVLVATISLEFRGSPIEKPERHNLGI